MTWFCCTSLPDTDDCVLVTDLWMDTVFLTYAETYEDGSRGWAHGSVSEKPHRYCWTKLVPPPDEIWQ